MSRLFIHTKHILFVGAFGLCLFITGCTSGTWGKLSHSDNLMGQYQDKGLADNYAYYYCGRSSIPYAVVGIDPSYTFDGRFWFKIESLDEVYDKIGRLSNLEFFHTIMHAKEILSPSGNFIGTWFSYYNTTGITVDEANKRVDVFNPYNPGSRLTDG